MQSIIIEFIIKKKLSMFDTFTKSEIQWEFRILHDGIKIINKNNQR